MNLVLAVRSGAVIGMMLLASTAVSGGVEDYVVPERHKPQPYMGRDYWRVLYKYGDGFCWSYWTSPARLTRFDNPSIYECPAFQDVAWSYFGRAPSPKPETGKATWRTLAVNFLEKDPDREILTSNPDPSKPFFMATTGKRSFYAWAGEVDLDADDYNRFLSSHPNLVYDGTCDEWLNDLQRAYKLMESMPNQERKRELVSVIGEHAPTSRYDIVRILGRYYAQRKRAYYNGRMRVLDGHLSSFHLAKDLGAELIAFESTDTCGNGTTPCDKVFERGSYECDGTPEDVDDNSTWRWNASAMFVRGAARQFKSIWEWYIAGYTNGWTEDGKWWTNTVTVYPESDEAPEWYAKSLWHCGPEFGQSSSNLRRALHFAYLCGCTFETFEEWTAQFTMWDKEKKRTVLSPRGKMYVDFVEFTRRHPDRGAVYAPVAVCVPVSQGYPTWGGFPWGSKRLGYTQGDAAVDAFFFTAIPGYERASEHRRGVEYNMSHSKFAHMYDVISPDVTSQSQEELLDVFKSYKVLVMAGDFDERKFKTALDRYMAAGGRVIRLDEKIVPPVSGDRVNEIMAGRIKFPGVERILTSLQDEYFPLKVEGDVCYGLNRTSDGWWLWAFNSKGVIKFVDKPARFDHAYDARLAVSIPDGFGKSVREITRDIPVTLSGNVFRETVPAGDLRIFEIK